MNIVTVLEWYYMGIWWFVLFIFFNFYLFIWLHWVLVMACAIFSCVMQILSCSLWDLVP